MMKYFILAGLILICSAADAEKQSTGEDKNNISLNRDVKKINSGFVFINGRYIESPYKVTIDEGWLAINGIRVKKLSEWPLTEESPEKPVIPERILKNAHSTFDLELWKYSAKMYRWIMRNIEKKEEQKKELKIFYESLPFVKQVNFSSSGEMNILLKNGKLEKWGSGFESVGPIVTKKQKLERLERRRKRIENRLEANHLYFFFGPGRLSYTERHAAENLKLMVEVLTSDKPEKEKLNILFRMQAIPESEPENALILIRNFRPSEQLNQRISILIKETGVTPHTLKTILKELPSVIEERQRKAEEQEEEKDTEDDENDEDDE